LINSPEENKIHEGEKWIDFLQGAPQLTTNTDDAPPKEKTGKKYWY